MATEYLTKKGYKIEERNFRTRFGEIDIVCWDKGILVFVEVKTKIGHDFGEPEEMVNKKKMAQVQRMGEVYVELKTSKTRSAQNAVLDLRPSSTSADPLRAGFCLHSCVSTIFNPEWMGQCRVDVVAIVLNENGEVERLEHYQAVY